MVRQSTGASYPAVSDRIVRESKIPLPYPDDPKQSLEEQKRIAAILDKADAIRRRRHEAAQLTDQLIPSIFYEMFGDPASNPRSLPTCALSKYGAVTTGNTPSRANPEFYGDAIEWIKSDNINTPFHVITRAAYGLSELGKKMARTVGPGATLVTCIAGSKECVGNAAMTDREVAFNQQINAISPGPGVNAHFLYALVLLSKRLIQRSSTQSMKGHGQQVSV